MPNISSYWSNITPRMALPLDSFTYFQPYIHTKSIGPGTREDRVSPVYLYFLRVSSKLETPSIKA